MLPAGATFTAAALTIHLLTTFIQKILAKEGLATYLVVFFPLPRNQTFTDVLHALRRFIEEVSGRHNGKAPVLYGNCQAGWAVMLLAADCEGLSGATVINGSPLSYWAGAEDANPLWLAVGLMGGSWPAHLLAILKNGRLDGARLVLTQVKSHHYS